ncbi:MAG TPA: competence/damage-inducible protein A [Ktedonobacterales bacterium]|nr:competence/damage-inducible protein A [Ktedonobacterales bacterium]
MRAEILSIGTELLLGNITDTNATYLAQQLAGLGIDLYFVSTVGDNQQRIVETMRRAWERADLIVTTGGLGPTEDDLTHESIAELLGEEMRVIPELEAELRAFFAGRGVVMPERNLKQATLIPSAKSLANPVGTAPGWWVERDGHIIVSMPGVPHEMMRMWTHEAVPLLRPRTGAVLFTRMLRVAGLGESTVEQRLQTFLQSSNPTIATYAKRDAVDVRVTAKAATELEAQELVAALEAQVREVLGTHIFGINDETLQSVLGAILLDKGWTLGAMESCTGGLFASTITDVAGSSDYFRGGLVSYTTEMKAEWGVSRETLEAHGAVSLETARAMASAARARLGVDVGVGITGVAGPSEQEGKPVGTVHIAVESPLGVATASPSLSSRSRVEVKWRATQAALNLARLHLLGIWRQAS